MRRWVGIVGIFLLLAAIVALILWWHLVQHWVAIHTGVEYAGPDKYYNAWSGILSDVGEVTIITGLVVFYRSHECHNPACHWPATHPTSDGHKLCKKCIGRPADDLNLHPVHDDHT